ncbi:Serine/threonine protein phosphatase [Handroanthus impetiginosus]|uniref:Protein phosphatase n=1 Tax=Handroanthus impetiginosus TaxID=429701 RepID=A0A2G9GP23_9LAMI|nr:Serine/threonine protein phosphatase [Handroanthus impetiginosus]
MADLFCSFLDFRSLTTNCNLHVFLPLKHHYSSALVQSHNSRISGTRRRPLHLTQLCKPSSSPSSSPNFDVISTHEHPDGSLLFRFGDPSEVAKNAKSEESKPVEKEKERKDLDGLVKVLDEDHETEGLVQKADGEVTGSGSTVVADPTSKIEVNSKSITVDQRETDDSCEKLLEDSNDIKSMVLTSSEEMEVASTPGVDVEQNGNVEEVVKEEYEDSSATNDTYMLDKSSEMESNANTETTADVATVVRVSEENVVTTDMSADSEHRTMESEKQNECIEDDGESVKTDLISPPPHLELGTSSSEEIEDQNLQVRMQNLMIGEGNDSDADDHLTVGMQNLVLNNANGTKTNDAEAEEVAISSEAQDSAHGTGTSNEISEYESEHDTVQLTTVSPQLKAEPMLVEESVTDDVRQSREDDGAENLKELNNTPQNVIVESESTEADDEAQRGDEASIHEVKELKSSASVTIREETAATDFVLSSGAALLPHPSKALTGGEDAYFIAGRTWIGVADGVQQWSLEGTKPGVYAQEIIKNCERLVSYSNGNSVNNPLELLNLSVAETQSPGSSTVLIAQFDGQALHVANVGDSGFIVLRNGAVYKRSSPMLHVFHFPMRIERGDDPSSLAELYRVDLEENDVLVTATDGLLDNLYDQEISSIIVKSLAADRKPEEIAELLATTAQEIGKSRSARSPFADDAQAAGFVRYSGGKLDDVAVIVSVVQTQQSNSQTL